MPLEQIARTPNIVAQDYSIGEGTAISLNQSLKANLCYRLSQPLFVYSKY